MIDNSMLMNRSICLPSRKYAGLGVVSSGRGASPHCSELHRLTTYQRHTAYIHQWLNSPYWRKNPKTFSELKKRLDVPWASNSFVPLLCSKYNFHPFICLYLLKLFSRVKPRGIFERMESSCHTAMDSSQGRSQWGAGAERPPQEAIWRKFLSVIEHF